ncbi:MAG: DUF4198 domain-containing protein [Planctomycetes bacterium]|nr:DUF4198 domain-containing protein [Planctomycetota bacterium]
MIRVSIAGSITCVALLAGGCGGVDHPTTHPVSGTVLYNGEPVADAVVSFQGENATKLATGRTDAQGRFTLATYEPGDGAVPGKHQVTVTKMTTVGGGSTGGSATMEEAAAAAETHEAPQERNELPDKYAEPGLSQLEFTVEPGQNDFKIELTD